MFSIIIPTLNNYNYLKLCIESLEKNSVINYQIIVHINVGADKTKDFLDENKIEYSFSDENIGLCKAVNIASKYAKYEYILYSHDDFYFCPGWDKALLNEIKAIGHNRFYLSSTSINTFGFKDLDCGNDYINFNERKLLNNFNNKSFLDLQGSTWAPHIVHKDYWKKVKGFSEEFFPGAGSDPDFGLKLWNNGVRIFKMIGESKVYHFESKTLRDQKKFKYFNSSDVGSKSSKLFLKKWGITIKFFKKHYLKANTIFKSELKEPDINLLYIFDMLFCKIKLLYLKILFKEKF
tara:strand:+ start:57 stop:932 length:876 start_codon:yes stop_codon:yes gene_type:complete